MNLRYLFLISTLVTACVFPRLALADESQQVKTYRAQCDQGDAEVCISLAEMYFTGRGAELRRDFDETFKLYRMGCDRGAAFACTKLGFIYEKGDYLGWAQNFFEAVALYRKACDEGHIRGCVHLGWMYHYGLGVRQSDTDALNYFGKACDMNDKGGCKDYATMNARITKK